ncbi:hypothetical protein KR009_005428, partial [Drosophila setifemur]
LPFISTEVSTMSASKVSAGILYGLFIYSRCMGLMFFKFKRNPFVLEERIINRYLWKIFLVIYQLVLLCTHLCAYILWVLNNSYRLDRLVHFSGIFFSIPCYLWMIYLSLFHGPELIQLVNRYLQLFRQVRGLPVRKKYGFGGEREMLLLLLVSGSQLIEAISIPVFWSSSLTLNEIIRLSSNTYFILLSNLIIRVNFVWYLSMGVMFSELNEYLRFETRFQINACRVVKILDIIREISLVTKSLQALLNIHLFLNIFQSVFYVIVVSYNMIVIVQLHDYRSWCMTAKVLLDYLLLSLAIQGAIDQFGKLRELILNIYGDLKECNRRVEIFVTHLYLYDLRVRALGLFDISNKLCLEMTSAAVTYILFIMQCVIEIQIG